MIADMSRPARYARDAPPWRNECQTKCKPRVSQVGPPAPKTWSARCNDARRDAAGGNNCRAPGALRRRAPRDHELGELGRFDAHRLAAAGLRPRQEHRDAAHDRVLRAALIHDGIDGEARHLRDAEPTVMRKEHCYGSRQLPRQRGGRGKREGQIARHRRGGHWWHKAVPPTHATTTERQGLELGEPVFHARQSFLELAA